MAERTPEVTPEVTPRVTPEHVGHESTSEWQQRPRGGESTEAAEQKR
jgi:hypothetical protein